MANETQQKESEIKNVDNDYFKVVKYPLMTEKSINLIDMNNEMIFVVDSKADKKTIKESIEKMFNAKVDRVNTLRDMKGRKRAYVKFNKETSAMNIATDLGLM